MFSYYYLCWKLTAGKIALILTWGRKKHKLSQKQQLQTMKSTVFNHEPHLQQIKSSDLCTKLQDLKSVEFNSEQQLPDVKPSELGLGTGTLSLSFNPGP